jgi:hypothetical protein
MLLVSAVQILFKIEQLPAEFFASPEATHTCLMSNRTFTSSKNGSMGKALRKSRPTDVVSTDPN